MPSTPPPNIRRTVLAHAAFALASCVLPAGARAQQSSANSNPDPRWHEQAVRMRMLAESWGDQPYGAVLVLHGTLIGEGPSRVVKDADPDAHAERVAIRDAQRKLGRQGLAGSLLYSTSRPCSLCEAAAAKAGVARMYFGPALTDAGRPHSRG